MTKVPKPWGHELILVNKEYCGKILYIQANHRTSLHYHTKKDEHFYVGAGVLLMEYEETLLGVSSLSRVILTVGSDFHINPKQLHRLSGLTDVTLVEFSTTHEESDTGRVEGGGPFKHDLGDAEYFRGLNSLAVQFGEPLSVALGKPVTPELLRELMEVSERRRTLLDKAQEKETTSDR